MTLALGHPDNHRPYEICGAKTRNEASNPVCQNRAGLGTNHLGTGRCKYHGGSSLVGPDSSLYKSGRYATAFTGRLRAKYEELAQETDEQVLNLAEELFVARTLLDELINRQYRAALPASTNDAPDKSYYRVPNTDAVGDELETGGDELGREQADDQVDAASVSSTSRDVENKNLDDGGVGVGSGSLLSSSWTSSSPTPRAKNLPIPEFLNFVHLYLDDIGRIATRMSNIKNSQALTAQELQFVAQRMQDIMENYIDDPKRRRAFIKEVFEVLPRPKVSREGEE